MEKLKPIGIKDREILLALKKEEYEEKGYPFDGIFYRWDNRYVKPLQENTPIKPHNISSYYNRIFVEKTLSLDPSLIREHFPVSVVVGNILEIYQDLLGVTFQEITGENWHPGMKIGFSCYYF